MGDHLKFPLAVIDEVLKVKETYANKDFIVGYRLSPEEAGIAWYFNGTHRKIN